MNDKVYDRFLSNLEPYLGTLSNENSIAHTELNSIPNGVSIENASYMENAPKLNVEENSTSINDGITSSINSEVTDDEEHTPQLFDEENTHESETRSDDAIDIHTEKLFDKDSNEEEDFEIPAFLRKQKF